MVVSVPLQSVIIEELLITGRALFVPTVILLMLFKGRLGVEDLAAVTALVREQAVFLLLVSI